MDFVKALAMGADAVALSNSALQAIGCVAARMCNTNNCPAGIATVAGTLSSLVSLDSRWMTRSKVTAEGIVTTPWSVVIWALLPM